MVGRGSWGRVWSEWEPQRNVPHDPRNKPHRQRSRTGRQVLKGVHLPLSTTPSAAASTSPGGWTSSGTARAAARPHASWRRNAVQIATSNKRNSPQRKWYGQMRIAGGGTDAHSLSSVAISVEGSPVRTRTTAAGKRETSVRTPFAARNQRAASVACLQRGFRPVRLPHRASRRR